MPAANTAPALLPGDFVLPTRRHDRGTLKRTSVRSAVITIGSQVAGLLLQTLSTVVLARLLAPQDYGVLAMVTSVTAFARIFQDLGLSAATVQKQELTHLHVSTVFWLNVFVGALLTLLVASLGPILAWFYKEPQVLWVTVVSSLGFLLGGLGAQHSALLKRAMRFRTLGVIQIVSSLIGLIVSIACALQSFRYWALVFGTLATSLSSNLMLWFSSRWVPSGPRRGTGLRGTLRFGAGVTGFEIVNYFARNADNLLIGRVWGPDILGLYSRAYSLLMLPINNLRNPLNTVAFPALSSLQNDPEKFRKYYTRYLSLLAFASMPLAALLFSTSDTLIRVVLGPKWAAASDLFAILAITGFIQPVAGTRGLILQSTGRVGRYFKWGLVNSVFVVLGFAIGVGWGPAGVAISYAIVNYILLHPSLLFSYADTPLRPRDFYHSVWRPLVASALATVAAIAFRSAVVGLQPLLSLACTAALFGVIYVSVFALTPSGLVELREYLSYRSFLRPDVKRA
jgi:polysaccharide transporter, PST family